jgi:hypothetical protein
LTAFSVSLIFIYKSDIISGELGGFHCSSIGSIIKGNVGCSDGVEEKVMVLMVRDPENAEVKVILVNNASRDGRVLKFVLVICSVKKY